MAMAAELELVRAAPAAIGAVARIGAVLAVAPPFEHAAVPRRVRALLAMALAVGIVPTLPATPGLPAGWGPLLISVGGDVIVGLAIGLALSLVFAAATWAGELIAGQMGLNLSEAYDPRSGGEGTSLGQAYWLLATVVFLAGNGHHALVRGLRASFDAIPVLGAANVVNLVPMLVGLIQSATVLALHLAAPVMVATLVADLGLGMVGRTIPQLGVMTAGVTIRAGVGLIVLVAAATVTAAVLQGATVNWVQAVRTAMGSIGR
jgi:flagellar biosynthetic protein FliR